MSVKNYLILIIFCIVFLFVFSFFDIEKIKNIDNKIPALVLDSLQEVSKKEIYIGDDLLGRAELSYAGGTEGRHKNIELGISRINGLVLQPGEEFSFKKALGSVSMEDGFSEERIFLNGEVTKGVGGGLCQVSTLIFRAAMSSALPITERANHSYSVSYYDTGLDATYSDPGPDVKFVNDTPNPIMIKGWTENLNAIFEIYGTHDGRLASTSEVVVSDIKDILPTKYVWVPELKEGQTKCMNTPQIGYTANVKYDIIYPNGEVKEQDFVSKYKPLQRICYIVGDEIKNFDINKTLNN